MNHSSFPEAVYLSRIKELDAEIALLKKRKNAVAWMRLAVVALLAICLYQFIPGRLLYAFLCLVVLGTVFVRMVYLSIATGSAIENNQRLLSVNLLEIRINTGIFDDQPEGLEFFEPTHSYVGDLDIFGKASLYQYFNRAQSQQGRDRFAQWLKQGSGPEEIHQRQEAVKELASQYPWRQQLQASGMEENIRVETEKRIRNWSSQPNQFHGSSYWRFLRWAYPVIALGSLALYLFDLIPAAFFAVAYIFFLVFSGYVLKKTMPQYRQLEKMVPEISTLRNCAALIENNSFQSAWLHSLQQSFTERAPGASHAIKKLKKILDNFDYNLNLLFLMLVNPFVLWNLQVIFSLEEWKEEHGSRAGQWFAGLAGMEAIASLANIRFNHPHWVFPELDLTREGVYEVSTLGHPLIAEEKMVVNDFSTLGTGKVSLITGSNMAGKSTFLRSVGISQVMAMCGSVVYAQRMKCSPMAVESSMRVADNLQESTSTFYAELKKLGAIIQKVNNQEKILVLLDEILRGTNSLDRHTGSKALVKQLIAKGAVALLATHDVELAKLEENFPGQISNYHFDAQLEGEELYFDYRLKRGICTNINASILMKKIGIEI